MQLSVEAITGSQVDDRLIGSDFNNVLDGGDGKDDSVAASVMTRCAVVATTTC